VVGLGGERRLSRAAFWKKRRKNFLESGPEALKAKRPRPG
jgi:hypothetical protein